MYHFDIDTYHEFIYSWYSEYGRQNLPWQIKRKDNTINPYHVWISEIMLQQTQVSTVISYFLKFIEQYPDIQTLAQADQDDVMSLWAGLGYYARARNLHKSAKIMESQFYSIFPDNYNDIVSLPGIGRSTASAILSIAFGKRYAILDGNVKRVLSRLFHIDEYIDIPMVEKKLWVIAQHLMPNVNTQIYTQSMMDIGATICKRKNPKCVICPLKEFCKAFLLCGTNIDFPKKKPKKKKDIRAKVFYIYQNQHDDIYLIKQPNVGIWGGLYSLPDYLDSELSNAGVGYVFLEGQKHTFTHFHLKFDVIIYKGVTNNLTLDPNGFWFAKSMLENLAIPSPIRHVLEKYYEDR